MTLRAFILCAGFGTRLRPITEKIPKPLIPILGKPLLERIIRSLYRVDINEIGINVYYLREKMINFIKNSPFCGKVEIFSEKEILGTGGGLKNAEPFLKNSPFLVHNGDILSDFDLKELISDHFRKRPLATLLVLENSEEKKLFLDEEGNLIGVEGFLEPKKYYQKVAFSGIALYEPEFLNFLQRSFSSVVSAWIEAIKAGYTIKTLSLRGFWFDCGSLYSYFMAVKTLLRNWGEMVYFHPKAKSDNLEFQGFLSVETETTFEKGSFLRDVVVIAEKRRVSGKFEGGLLFEEIFIPLKENKEPFEEIGFGGSERKFFRLFNGNVLMKDEKSAEDFERTYQYGLLLRKKGIKVPEIRGADFKRGEIFFEDLGDISLYTWLKGKRDKTKILGVYKKVIEEVIKLHTLKIEEPKLFRVFDFEHFRWETRYFKEKFLEFLCGIKASKELEEEFDSLAKICDSFPKNLIHRDLQSQNIMIKGDVPYLIDYQGARIGPPGYDIASLLWDPYYRFGEEEREELLKFYIEKRMGIDRTFDKDIFLESLRFLRIQRHLQALAAYVNLSFFKGKSFFLKFIPQALSYLEEEVLEKDWPVLKRILLEAIDILKKKGFYAEMEKFS
ncbi:MAG: sugar phosphate nucleotidyltransferase [Caldimicrobium thiodismutans]